MLQVYREKLASQLMTVLRQTEEGHQLPSPQLVAAAVASCPAPTPVRCLTMSRRGTGFCDTARGIYTWPTCAATADDSGHGLQDARTVQLDQTGLRLSESDRVLLGLKGMRPMVAIFTLRPGQHGAYALLRRNNVSIYGPGQDLLMCDHTLPDCMNH